MHHLVDLWQLLQIDSLEWRLDDATSEEFKRFSAVLSIANVAALNANHLDHRLEDRSLNLSPSRKTNDNDNAARPDVLSSLLKRFLAYGDEDGSVRSESILGRFTDIFVDVFRSSEVNEGLQSSELARPSGKLEDENDIPLLPCLRTISSSHPPNQWQ